MCCGSNNTQCCDSKAGVFAFDGVPINATSGNGSSDKLSGGAIGGIAVGGVCAVLLLAVIVLLLLRFRSDRKKGASAGAHPSSGSASMDVREHVTSPAATTLHSNPSFRSRNDLYPYTSDKHAQPYQYQYPYPADKVPRAPMPVHELAGSQNAHEVSGRSVHEQENMSHK